MDPYIINNMPDDPQPILTADLHIVDESAGAELFLVNDGDSYVLTIATVGADTETNGANIVAAFDPTLSLTQAFSVIALIARGNVVAMSDELTTALADKLGEVTE